MRISDWSSDVCSSDLLRPDHPQPDGTQRERTARGDGIGTASELRNLTVHEVRGQGAGHEEQGTGSTRKGASGGQQWSPLFRSEEHTSELQSLMRLSYAVFCLKKKKQYNECDDDTTQK